MTTEPYEQLTLFSVDELHDIQEAADEHGEPWQQLVRDAVMNAVAASAVWGNARPA